MKKKFSMIGMIVSLMAAVFLTGCTTASERAYHNAIQQIEDGAYEEALENLDKAIEKADLEDGNSVTQMIHSYYLIGDCFTKLGKTDLATAAYDQALEEDLKNRSVEVTRTGTSYLRRGLIYVSREDYANALTAFQEGLACEEQECTRELMRNEIICCEKVGDWATAKSEAQKYVEDFPDDVDMRKECDFLLSR